MFSTTRAEYLLLREIAEFIASEAAPSDPDRRRKYEADALLRLESGWWSGELDGQGPRTRLEILRDLFIHFANEIAFVLPGGIPPKLEIELSDGGVFVDQRLVVPVPSDIPSVWTGETCEGAFKGLSAGWHFLRAGSEGERKAYTVFEPAIRGVAVSRAEFFRWLESRRIPRSNFWVDVESDTSAKPTKPRAYVPLGRMEEWYRSHVQTHQKARTFPTAEEDFEAAKKLFGNRVRRDSVRKLRAELSPPEWRKPGRRPSAIGQNESI